MTAFAGTLIVQISADTKDEAQRTFDGIAKRSSEHPFVHSVEGAPVSKVPSPYAKRRPRHA